MTRTWKIMLMHANDFNMDRWQMTTAHLWVVHQCLASSSSFNDINELQTSRASPAVSRCLHHVEDETLVQWLLNHLSLTPSCDHHVSTMWPPCYHPMPQVASSFCIQTFCLLAAKSAEGKMAAGQAVSRGLLRALKPHQPLLRLNLLTHRGPRKQNNVDSITKIHQH